MRLDTLLCVHVVLHGHALSTPYAEFPYLFEWSATPVGGETERVKFAWVHSLSAYFEFNSVLSKIHLFLTLIKETKQEGDAESKS